MAWPKIQPLCPPGSSADTGFILLLGKSTSLTPSVGPPWHRQASVTVTSLVSASSRESPECQVCITRKENLTVTTEFET